MLGHIKIFFPKYISGLLTLVLIANIVLFAVLMTPKEAKAIPVEVTADPYALKTSLEMTRSVATEIKHVSLATMAAAEEKGYHVFDTNKSIWDQFKSNHGVIAEITSSLFLVMMHQVLAKITNDIVAWINGGGKGKIRILQDPGKFLRDAADEAGGVLMGAILNVDPKTLCDASFLKQKLAITFAGPYAVPTFDEKVACTFSGMADGLRKFREDFRNGGWQAFIEYTQKQNNQIGQTLIVADEMARIKEERSAEAVAKLNISKGFLAQEKCTVEKGPASDPKKWVGQDIEKAFKEAGSGFSPSSYDFTTSESNRLDAQYDYQINEARRLGLDTSDAMWYGEYRSANPSNSNDFKSWLISNGGKVSCKTVTPAEQVSELASTALQAPIKKLEGAIEGLTNKLGTGMGSVLKPYVLAIGNASLNLLLKKEMGLVNDLFTTPPKKDRRISQRPSDAVQQGAMNASAAGQVAASANGFQAFIMKSLVDFSIFVSSAAQVMDESSELGRLPLSRLEYARMFNKLVSGDVPARFLNSNTTADAKVGEKLVGNLEGWKTNVDCEAAVFNTATTTVPVINNTGNAYDANQPFASTMATSSVPFTVYFYASSTTQTIPINIAVCGDTDSATAETQLGPTSKMITTYPSGKTLFEEASWCGAYSQETPLDVPVNEDPMPAMVWYNPIPNTDPNLYAYNDDEDGDDIIDRIRRGDTSSEFTETLIFPHSDTNHDNKIDYYKPNDYLADFDSLRPRVTNMRINIDGNNISDFSASGALVQATAANGYVFGGYRGLSNSSDIIAFIASGGHKFSDVIYDINGSAIPGVSLPIPLAGAEAVYYPPENRIYIFGGRNMNGYSGAVYEFNPANNSIQTMSARLPKPAYGLTGAYDPRTQRIYLFGGKVGETRATSDQSVLITDAMVSDQILEFNQQTDTIIAKNNKLPEPLAHSSAVPLIDSDGKRKIFLFGGMDSFGQGVGSILAYDPTAFAGNGSVKQKSKAIQPRGYLATLPLNSANINNATGYTNTAAKIFGGEDVMGRWNLVQEYNTSNDSLINRTGLSAPLSQMARSLEDRIIIGGIINADPNTNAARIFPQGDVYYIPGNADAISKKQPVFQKYFSPTYEDASVSLLNIREDRVYKDPTLTVLQPFIMSEPHKNSDEVYLPRDAFYPELAEKIQELSEKLRILKGYHYKESNRKDYTAGIAQQVGSAPDDDPYDNNPRNPLYPDRPNGDNEANCESPNEWNQDLQQCLRKGYKGSVSDVTTKYKNLADIYSVLYSGATDERALEGIDPNMAILAPEETNIKLALIGRRCPTLRPSGTSTPDIAEGCPSFGGTGGEYNMAKRFMFEGDDTRQSPTGLTTGFATNPLNNKKSSSLAGILNLDEMATQLQAMPPDKNIIKLIRLRQILEQLQVWDSATVLPGENPKSIRSFRAPGSNTSTTPDALTGVDTIQVSLFGFEKIQNWLNATSTSSGLPDKNKDIQELIEAYGYTNAKEAYPEISKDLDTILQDAVNQVTDKVREVFVKRTEEAMEQARLNAEYRLKRFIEYARDLNPTIKLSLTGDSTRRMGSLIDQINDQIDSDLYILRAEPFTSSPNDPHWVNNIISGSVVDNNERSGLIGAAIYKIRSLANFIGMNTDSVEFTAMMTGYRQSRAQSSSESDIRNDLNTRLSKSATDTYLLYRGVSDQTNPNLSPSERARTSGHCGFSSDEGAHYCDLNAQGTNNQPKRIYKDATMKIKELGDDFGLMMEEFSKIKEEFTNAVNEGQNQKQAFEDLLAGFSSMEESFEKANACVGMPGIKWTPPAYVNSLYQTLGGSAAAALSGLATVGVASLFGYGTIGGVLTTLGLGSGGVLLPLAVGIAFIAGIVNYFARKKAKKKYNKAVRKAVNECKEGLREYNRLLGQFADNFVCGRANQIYQEQ